MQKNKSRFVTVANVQLLANCNWVAFASWNVVWQSSGRSLFVQSTTRDALDSARSQPHVAEPAMSCVAHVAIAHTDSGLHQASSRGEQQSRSLSPAGSALDVPMLTLACGSAAEQTEGVCEQVVDPGFLRSSRHFVL